MAATNAGNLFAFNADLKKFSRTVGVEFSKVKKKVSFDIFAGLIDTTPVDTGRARSGWAMTDSSPSAFVAPEGAASYPKPSVAEQPASFADPYSLIYIVNNVPYIRRLEFGHSKQAPNGMVRVTIARVESGLLAQL